LYFHLIKSDQARPGGVTQNPANHWAWYAAFWL